MSNVAYDPIQMQAEFCSAFSDPTRILILYVLDEKNRNVSELAKELHLSHSTTSRHLKVLRDVGMVNTARHGTVVEYQLADPRLIQVLNILRSIMRDWIANRASLLEDSEV